MERGESPQVAGAVSARPSRSPNRAWLKSRHCGETHGKVGDGRRRQSLPSATRKTCMFLENPQGVSLRQLAHEYGCADFDCFKIGALFCAKGPRPFSAWLYQAEPCIDDWAPAAVTAFPLFCPAIREVGLCVSDR